jgi:hypothetical protein
MTARRIAVGFDGGQVLSLRVEEDALEGLRRAVRSVDDAYVEVNAVDGAVLLDRRKVAYLRVESDEHRVGF